MDVHIECRYLCLLLNCWEKYNHFHDREFTAWARLDALRRHPVTIHLHYCDFDIQQTSAATAVASVSWEALD